MLSDESSSDGTYHDSESEYEDNVPNNGGDKKLKISNSPQDGKGPISSQSSPSLNKKTSKKNKNAPIQPIVDEELVDVPEVGKAVFNELLLSVQNLGTSTDENGEFVRSEDCYLWLGDIQRVIAKDDPDVRHIHNLLSSWNVLSKKFIPLLKLSKDDDDLVLTMLKIFSLMTTPITSAASKDAAIKIDPKSATDFERELKGKKKEIALRQFENLLLNKECFIDSEVIALIVAWLHDVVGQGIRTEQSGLKIELVLTFVRNLLTRDAPSADFAKRLADVHDRLISVLHEQHMLEIILLFAQDIESRENKVLNILLMEIVHHMTRDMNPETVADAYVNRTSATPTTTSSSSSSSTTTSSLSAAHAKPAVTTNRRKDKGGPSLRELALAGRSSSLSMQSARHSHFGGAVRMKGTGGRAALISSNMDSSISGRSLASSTQPAPKFQRRKLAFNASQRSGHVVGKHAPGKADEIVADFCKSFLEDSFVGFMKSVKTEFRVESMRLEQEDKVKFFRMTRFFLALQRHVRNIKLNQKQLDKEIKKNNKKLEKNKKNDKNDEKKDEVEQEYSDDDSLNEVIMRGRNNKTNNDDDPDAENDKEEEKEDDESPGEKESRERIEVALMSAMDLYCFSLVHRSVDEFAAEKKWGGLEYATELLTEMTAYLWHLRANSTGLGGGLRRIALNLMGALYFSNDPTDRLPKLLKAWQPATFSRVHLTNLVAMSYYTFKLLDMRTFREDILDDKDVNTLFKVATEFQLASYLKKLTTNEIVAMFRLMLESYSTNNIETNHHALSFLTRLTITNSDGDDDYSNNSGEVKATFAPMLYNVPFLILCEKVLNDRNLKKSTQIVNQRLLSFCAGVVRHFTRLASSNNVLFLEALFQQPALQRTKFCRSAISHYVNPDTFHQMHEVERQVNSEGGGLPLNGSLMKDSFLNESDKKNKRNHNKSKKNHNDDDSDEDDEEYDEFDEDEFDVDADVIAAPKKVPKLSSSSNRRSNNFTEAEDDLLRELYKKYSGTRAVLEVVSEEFAETYRVRDIKMIKNRLIYLKVATRASFISTNDDDENDNEREEDEDDDDDEEGGGRILKKKEKIHLVSVNEVQLEATGVNESDKDENQNNRNDESDNLENNDDQLSSDIVTNKKHSLNQDEDDNKEGDVAEKTSIKQPLEKKRRLKKKNIQKSKKHASSSSSSQVILSHISTYDDDGGLVDSD